MKQELGDGHSPKKFNVRRISIVAVEDDDTQFSSAPDSNQLIKWATITGTMLTWDTAVM